jgi:hypothetical protein
MILSAKGNILASTSLFPILIEDNHSEEIKAEKYQYDKSIKVKVGPLVGCE